MWGGRGQDQGIRVGRQDVGQLIVLGGLVGHVVGLIDHHGIPVMLAQIVDKAVLLEGVDRDNDLLEERERVAGGRKLLLDLLHALRIQAHEGDGEARPQLVLHLLQHVARRHDQNPPAAAPANQFGEDHADLQRLAQTHGIRDEQPGAQPTRFQGLLHRVALIGQRIRERMRGQGGLRIGDGQGRLAQRGLQPQPRLGVVRADVRDYPGLRGILRADGIDAPVELRGSPLHQLAHAAHREQFPVCRLLHRGHQPLLIPHLHDGTGGNV